MIADIHEERHDNALVLLLVPLVLLVDELLLGLLPRADATSKDCCASLLVTVDYALRSHSVLLEDIKPRKMDSFMTCGEPLSR